MPEKEAAEIAEVLRSYGLEADQVATVVSSIRADKKRLVDFMMRFELGLEEPDPPASSPQRLYHRALIHRRRISSAGTVLLPALGAICPDWFHRGDVGGAPGVWVHHGSIYHGQTAAQYLANGVRGRARGHGGLCHREGSRLTSITAGP